MAELSTIARPYAHGLMQALKDRNAGAEDMAKALESLDVLALISRDPQVAKLVGDPRLTDDQLFALIAKSCEVAFTDEVTKLLSVIIENGRLDALSEIARQFRELKNASAGVADAYVETAFELTQEQLDSLMVSLSQKFPGLQLKPIVSVNPALIGGLTVRVGDQLLDASIRSRLAQMKTTLTA